MKNKRWLITQPSPKNAPTMIYFHGNAGNIGYRLDRLRLFYYTLKVNIIICDYRGYASSTGSPSEHGLELDADAIMKFALENEIIDPTQIIIYGKSLGGAVGIYLAEKYQSQIKCAIIENTFSNMGSMIDQHATHLKYFKPFILRNIWPSINRIAKIERPILFIYGERDEIIATKNMLDLHEAAKTTVYKELKMVRNGDHNMCYVYGGALYLSYMEKFIDKVQREFPLQMKKMNITNNSITHDKSD